jgi:hypothetical protein
MVQISRSRFLAAICAVGTLAGLSLSAHADEYATNLGPVGPNEPILANVGGQRVIAFFTPERGSCAVNTIVWKDTGADTPNTSSRVRVTLRPGEMVKFDDARLAMNLLCGADASTLSAVAPAELILTSAHATD